MTIAYQGIPGSYSFICAQNYFGKNPSADGFIGTDQFKDIFDLVEDNKADYGVVPVENSLAGSVYENYDLLALHNLQVVGEYYLKIEHCLLGLAKDIKEIKNIYSHPKALEQCLKLFNKYPQINKNIFADTASAAKYVSEKRDSSLAAIASSDAAKFYKLKIIKKNIEDNPYNYTRFLIINKNITKINNADKCSIIFKLPHKPGSLYKTLKYFANKNINLTKIESRPIHGLPFEYNFYIDLGLNGYNVTEMRKIIEEFRQKVHELKILGIYKNGYENVK